MCRDGCNLRTLVVGMKALHRIEKSQYIIGGSPPLAMICIEEKIIYRRSGYLYLGEVERFPDVIYELHDNSNHT